MGERMKACNFEVRLGRKGFAACRAFSSSLRPASPPITCHQDRGGSSVPSFRGIADLAPSRMLVNTAS